MSALALGALAAAMAAWAPHTGRLAVRATPRAAPPLARYVEVLPPVPDEGEEPEARPGLSDQSVSRILELVWRDTRKVASEYQFGDITKTVVTYAARPQTSNAAPPFVWSLVADRLPLLRWYAFYKLDQGAIAFNEWWEELGISPRSAADRRRTRAVLQQRFDARRARLWPTLRALLLTASMHRRVVRAAQTQILTSYDGDPRAMRRGWMLRSPGRLFQLWFASLRAFYYGWRWLLNEFGLRWLVSANQRQRVRTKLIERAIDKGLELQRRVETIEDDAKRKRTLLLPAADGVTMVRNEGEVQQQAIAVVRLSGRVAQWLERRFTTRS